MDSTDGFDLPDDLKIALREVKKQYRIREIKEVEGPVIKEDLLSFMPDPEADGIISFIPGVPSYIQRNLVKRGISVE